MKKGESGDEVAWAKSQRTSLAAVFCSSVCGGGSGGGSSGGAALVCSSRQSKGASAIEYRSISALAASAVMLLRPFCLTSLLYAFCLLSLWSSTSR